MLNFQAEMTVSDKELAASLSQGNVPDLMQGPINSRGIIHPGIAATQQNLSASEPRTATGIVPEVPKPTKSARPCTNSETSLPSHRARSHIHQPAAPVATNAKEKPDNIRSASSKNIEGTLMPPAGSRRLPDDPAESLLNTTFQLLISLPAVRNLIKQHPLESCDESACLACTFQQVVAQSPTEKLLPASNALQSLRHFITDLTERIAHLNPAINLSQYREPAHVLVTVLDMLSHQASIFNTSTTTPAEALGRISMSELWACSKCHNRVAVGPRSPWCLALHIPPQPTGSRTSTWDLSQLWRRNHVMNGLRYCSKCKEKLVQARRAEIHTFSETLFVRLARFTKLENTSSKTHARVKIPPTLDAAIVVGSGKAGENIYRLSSVICHEGSALDEQSHFTLYLHEGKSLKYVAQDGKCLRYLGPGPKSDDMQSALHVQDDAVMLVYTKIDEEDMQAAGDRVDRSKKRARYR